MYVPTALYKCMIQKMGANHMCPSFCLGCQWIPSKLGMSYSAGQSLPVTPESAMITAPLGLHLLPLSWWFQAPW